MRNANPQTAVEQEKHTNNKPNKQTIQQTYTHIYTHTLVWAAREVATKIRQVPAIKTKTKGKLTVTFSSPSSECVTPQYVYLWTMALAVLAVALLLWLRDGGGRQRISHKCPQSNCINAHKILYKLINETTNIEKQMRKRN